MHLLYNKTVEINIFKFQSQKQPLLICCPFTKPTNDSFLPSNSRGLFVLKIHEIWTHMRYIFEIVNTAILLLIMSVTWTVYSLIT